MAATTKIFLIMVKIFCDCFRKLKRWIIRALSSLLFTRKQNVVPGMSRLIIATGRSSGLVQLPCLPIPQVRKSGLESSEENEWWIMNSFSGFNFHYWLFTFFKKPYSYGDSAGLSPASLFIPGPSSPGTNRGDKCRGKFYIADQIVEMSL